jgi:anhydro-N-acetylmuramic acid kinase
MSAALLVGAISGTSVDGLDLAVLEASEPPSIVAGRTVAIPPDLTRLLKDLGSGKASGLDSLGEADHRMGSLIGESIVALLADLSLPSNAVAAIGSHGQTVRHRTGGDTPFSLQIGDPNLIAEITGIDTVADFRRRDMAAGGQGAPLVPPFHEALFRTPAESRTVLNIGGIANISVLPAEVGAEVIGFDTGPGNALIDAWAEHHLGVAYDNDGAWARTGLLDSTLLQRMMTDPYFKAAPPKSTGKELFNLAWLETSNRARDQRNPADVQSTLAELTAATVHESIRRWAPTTSSVIVCGGGRLNSHLMERLADRLSPIPVLPTEAFGYNGDWIEAAAFAWLAHRTLSGQTGSDRAVTGARASRVLGAIYRKAV